VVDKIRTFRAFMCVLYSILRSDAGCTAFEMEVHTKSGEKIKLEIKAKDRPKEYENVIKFRPWTD
jgi:hypothetical protein